MVPSKDTSIDSISLSDHQTSEDSYDKITSARCSSCSNKTENLRRGPKGKALLCTICTARLNGTATSTSITSNPDTISNKRKREETSGSNELSTIEYNKKQKTNNGEDSGGAQEDGYYCRYCNKSWPPNYFKNSKQFGAHCSNCSRKSKTKTTTTTSSESREMETDDQTESSNEASVEELEEMLENSLAKEKHKNDIEAIEKNLILLSRALKKKDQDNRYQLSSIKNKIKAKFFALEKSLNYNLEILGLISFDGIKESDAVEQKEIESLNATIQTLSEMVTNKKNEVQQLKDSGALDSPTLIDDLNSQINHINLLLGCECRYKIQKIQQQGENTNSKCENCLQKTSKQLKKEFEQRKIDLKKLLEDCKTDMQKKSDETKKKIHEIEAFLEILKKDVM